jgi:hypothetical protein
VSILISNLENMISGQKLLISLLFNLRINLHVWQNHLLRHIDSETNIVLKVVVHTIGKKIRTKYIFKPIPVLLAGWEFLSLFSSFQ